MSTNLKSLENVGFKKISPNLNYLKRLVEKEEMKSK